MAVLPASCACPAGQIAAIRAGDAGTEFLKADGR
jgi:hypothetical protein